MKKLLTIIIALVMMIGSGTSIAEEPTNFDIKLPTEYAMGGVFNYKDNYYYYDYSNLYVFDENANDIKIVADLRNITYDGETVRIQFFINDGDKLYAITFREECVSYSADIGDNGISLSNRLKLDTKDLEKIAQSYNSGYEELCYMPSPQSATIVDGKLYCLFNGDYQVTQNLILIGFDLATGESRQYESEFMFAICPYKDGKLLALTMDYDKLFSSADYDNRPTLCVFNPENDTLEEIGKLDKAMHGNMFGGMLYEEDKDALLYVDSYSVMRRFMDGTTEKCAYLPNQHIWAGLNGIAHIAGGRIAIVDSAEIYVRSTDPAKLPKKSLTVFGGFYDDELKKAVARKMPDVAVNFLEDKWFSSAQELGQALISGEDGIDLLILSPSWMDTNSLFKKGYSEGLNASETITQYMDSIYPVLKKTGVFEDKIYAIPIELNIVPVLYNEIVFEELKINKPENFFDLCDVMQKWNDEYADDGEYLLTRNSMRYEEFFSYMLHAYMLDRIGIGEDIVLDTPLFREMAQRCESLKHIFDNIEAEPDYNDMEAVDEYYNRKALFSFNNYTSIENISQYYIQYSTYKDGEADSWFAAEPSVPFAMAAKEGLGKFIPINAQYAFVNSQSSNKETAIEYLENLIRCFNLVKQTELYPDKNEPIINEDYEKQLSEMEKGVESLEKTVEKAEGAEKTAAEENLKNYISFIERYKKSSKYKITEQAIKVYRELIDCAILPEFSNSTLVTQRDLLGLLSRYYDGQISLEQYIKEADSKLKLIELEGQ